MQLLLRQPAQRLLLRSEEAEVAASPDSPGRENWQWDIRLSRAPASGEGSLTTTLEADEVGAHHVNVRFDARVIDAEMERCIVDDIQVLWRDEMDLCVAIMESGAMSEGIFQVSPGDVMVWEGDDPRSIALAPLGGEPAGFVLVRIRRQDGRALRWVP
ncbi:MAG: hypothetical protein ACR2KE_02385 [Candidatus Nanopelagicales bacterium]